MRGHFCPPSLLCSLCTQLQAYSFFSFTNTRSGKESDAVRFDPDAFLDVMKAMLDKSSSSLPNGKGGADRGEEFDGDEEFSDGSVSSEEDIVEEEAAVGEDGRDEEMAEVMEQMDRELGVTEVGKSFEKMKVFIQV